jgi:hypothetical protein
MDDGLSLPLLLTTFSSEGLEFGHAARHLFPLLHGNEEGTRWDFLLNYGTVYDYDDYSAVDLKFLFNYQQRSSKGTAWGFLPYPIGHHPGTRLNPGVRYVQLTNHALSYWNVEEDWGFQALDPFLLSYEEEGGEVPKAKLNLGPFGLLYKQKSESSDFENSSLWGLLHSYESREESSAMTLGPLGILFRSNKTVDETAYRYFWIFGYKSTPQLEQVTFLWMNLYINHRSTIYPSKIEAPHGE